MGEMIGFNGGPDHYEGYLATSAKGSGPGIIVLQEYWGLVPHIKDVCDRFADEGFTALAPDLYRGDTTRDPSEAATLMQALNISQTEQILRKAILTLLARPETSSERVGVVGFCMGGQLALFAASANPVVSACADFYGIHPKVQPSYRNLNGPVLGIFAERDNYAPPEVVKALDEELTLLGKAHEFHTYPGTDHAFFNDTRPEVYNAEAAADAWKRLLAFFRANVG
ncbi:MAG TPA: dienelactone hydrolase family protein [Fimbriimonadaceae bacterium]|nr:dienelactone hydrolase family protein [Fimbriimonadaceae bacterium]